MKNLIFIGMPAVGKSTVGVIVAKRLGMQFVDTDLVIQQEEGRLLRDIISTEGEDGFLAIENRINSRINVENTVIAPGGSAIYGGEAMRHFKEIGIVIYLKVSYREIRRRIRDPKKRGVVLRPGQTLKDLYYERVPYFEKYADITVSEDGCRLEDTITNVLRAIALYTAKNRKINSRKTKNRRPGKQRRDGESAKAGRAPEKVKEPSSAETGVKKRVKQYGRRRRGKQATEKNNFTNGGFVL